MAQRQKKRLKDILPYSDISKVLGLNVKMLQRYDNSNSVSERNRSVIETFINKYENDTQYRVKIDLVLDNSRKEASEENAVVMAAMKPIIGTLIESVVVLNHEINELYKIVDKVLTHMATPDENSDPYIILTLQSTMARIDQDLKKVQADIDTIQNHTPAVIKASKPNTEPGPIGFNVDFDEEIL